MSHKFDSSILREYDIRGIVGGTVHAADARAIGRTLGTLVKRQGRQARGAGLRRPAEFAELAAACIEGLTAAGIDVLDIGLAATRCFILPSTISRPTAASRSPGRTIRRTTTASR